MRRSKVEIYVDILSALANHGPLKLTHMMYKVNVSCSVLKGYLDLLLAKNLVEQRTVGNKRILLTITERGTMVLEYFGELKEALPIIEETRN
jgi:predicted transcriptional regulator